MLALSLSLSLSLSAPPQAQQVFSNLVASYPWGPQLCMTVSDDDRRAFVAAGAALTVLDVEIIETGVRPEVLHRLELPDCQPVSMVFHRPSGTIQRRIYIAGGTTGLWEVPICDSLFASPPVECPSLFYTNPYSAPRLLKEIVSSQFHRKRCVDVCVVEGNASAGTPLLFALFSALADGPFPATELHAFKILPTGNTVPDPNNPGQFIPADTIAYGTPLSFGTGAPGSYSRFTTGTALASDPGDPDHLYVGLGKGGLVRVTIGASGTLAAESLSRPPCPVPSRCPCDPTAAGCDSPGEAIRDLAVARTATRAFLYAASEYNGLVEWDLTNSVGPPSGWSFSLMPSGSELPGYAERVAAVTTQDEMVFVAVGMQAQSYVLPESRAPFRNTGHWSDLCLASGVFDPNYSEALFLQSGNRGARTVVTGASRVHWLDRDALDPTFRPVQRESHPIAPHFGTLYMHRAGECDYRLYECTDEGGSVVRQLCSPQVIGAFDPHHLGTFIPEPETWDIGAAHLDRVFSASDGVVSKVNPGLLFFGLDGPTVLAEPEANMFYVTLPPTEDIVPVLGTLGTPSLLPAFQPNSTQPTGYEDPPNPFVGALLHTATWIDPNDPQREWFIPGDRMLRKFLPMPLTNPVVPVPAENCSDPNGVVWRLTAIPGSVRSRVGWRPTTMKQVTLPPTQAAPTAADIAPNLKWWQVVSPTLAQDDRSATSPYLSSEVVFGASGTPVLVVGVRGGTDLGLKVFQAPGFMSMLDNSVCSQPVPVGVGASGRGEAFTQGTNVPPAAGPPFAGEYPEFHEAVTHMELEVPGLGLEPCVQYSKCDVDENPGAPIARRNSRSAVFTATDLSGSGRRAVIVASGFVTTPPDPLSSVQYPHCQWSQYYGRALLAIYDLEDSAAFVESPPTTGSWPPPALLRMCVGPPVAIHGETHAWAVCVMEYPGAGGSPARRFAFVGDILGKLLVYDLSGGSAASNQLYPPHQTGFPYIPGGPPYSTINPPPVLLPVAVIHFPKDADDGMGVNCVDLELDLENRILYCANARSGVAVVDISDPLNPLHIANVDTPGMALGLTTWTTSAGQRRLVVGDSLCGARVYSY